MNKAPFNSSSICLDIQLPSYSLNNIQPDYNRLQSWPVFLWKRQIILYWPNKVWWSHILYPHNTHHHHPPTPTHTHQQKHFPYYVNNGSACIHHRRFCTKPMVIIHLHIKCTVKYAASSFTTWLGRHSSLVVQSCASYAENARTCTHWLHYDTKQCTPYKTSVLWKSVKTSALEHSSLVGEKAALYLCPASGLNWYFHQRQYIYNIYRQFRDPYSISNDFTSMFLGLALTTSYSYVRSFITFFT